MSTLFSCLQVVPLLLAVSLLLVVEVGGQCSDSVTCPDPNGPPTNLPDPEDCSSYYLCVGGCAIHQKCQDDFLFDVTENYCNYPELVDCEDRPCEDQDHCLSTSSTSTSSTPTTTDTQCNSTLVPPATECPAATVDFVDVYDCTRYYHCEKGCSYHILCGVGELFDPATKTCLQSSAVRCGHRHCSDTERCPCINYDEMVEEMCPENEEKPLLFPDMRECARYLNCTAGCFTSVLCPNDWLYNIEHQWCSYNHEINCGERPCKEDPSRCH